jgi:hypothetical protein
MSTSDPGGTVGTGPSVGSRNPGQSAGTGEDAASGAKDQAQEKAQQAAGQVQDKAQQAAGQAKEQAQQVAGQGKDRAKTLVDERSTQAGEQVSTQASDIRTVGQKLREEGKEGPAKIADQAADRAERLGGYLKDSNADRILQDLEELGRKQPLAVMFGGLALGFAASRFLKASSSERYEQRGSGMNRPRPEYASRPDFASRPPALPQRSAGSDGPSVAVEDRPMPATGVGATPLPPASPGTRGL